jgi:hypothetical protein
MAGTCGRSKIGAASIERFKSAFSREEDEMVDAKGRTLP